MNAASMASGRGRKQLKEVVSIRELDGMGPVSNDHKIRVSIHVGRRVEPVGSHAACVRIRGRAHAHSVLGFQALVFFLSLTTWQLAYSLARSGASRARRRSVADNGLATQRQHR